MTEHDLHLIEIGEKVGAEKERERIVSFILSFNNHVAEALAKQIMAEEHLK